MSEWTIERITRLMTSGGGQPRGVLSDYARLAYAVEKGWVSIQRLPIKIYPEPEFTAHSDRSVYLSARKGNARDEHHDLKWYAWNWIRETCNVPAQFEVGGRDVYADSINLTIECGDTDPRKYLWDSVSSKADDHTLPMPNDPVTATKFGVLPFPWYDPPYLLETGMYVYTFEATPQGLRPMLNHLWTRHSHTTQLHKANRDAMVWIPQKGSSREVKIASPYEPEYLGDHSNINS